MSKIGLQRAARVKAVVAACRSQGIDDDARHDLQLALTGKSSLTDMSFAEVSRVLDHLNSKGTAEDGWRFVFKLGPERRSYGKKIFRLAQRAGALAQPPVPVVSKAYVEGITRQMRGTDQPLEFCDCAQLHKVIQALEVYLRRHGA